MLIETLSERTGVPVSSLENIAKSASRRYFEFTIPKRNGEPRAIFHPSRKLKAIQRWLSRNLIARAPIHEAATAYSKGSSIRNNALNHTPYPYTTRLDFENFFPSFDGQSVDLFLRKISDSFKIGLTERDLIFSVRILCRNNQLAIGAPSSPKISNAMMFDFDTAAYNYANERDMMYTRYADDIFISGFSKDNLFEFQSFIFDLVVSHSRPALKLNSDKTKHLSRSGHRSVTGLIITPSGEISIGRGKKREIKTLLFLALSKNLSPIDKAKLVGYLSFVMDVEPSFIDALGRKFEIDVKEWIKAL